MFCEGSSSYGTCMFPPADASQNSFSQGTLVLPRLLRPCLSAGIATYQPRPSVDLLQSFHELCYPNPSDIRWTREAVLKGSVT
jgi:hypothetical protein